VALVVGNRRYLDQHWDQLDNARSDSRQVCAAFAASGFRVILLEDASRDDLAAAVALFGDLAAKAETAVFYFAGHGFEYAGDNYLVPSDAPTETSRANLRGLFVNLAEPLAAANRAKHPVAFLDACRSRAAIVRVVDADEKGPDGPPGFIGLPDRFSGVVFYSTARGSVAYDARPFPTGTNSPFASAVVDWLATPGVNLTDYIGFVMEDVKSGTERFPYGVQARSLWPVAGPEPVLSAPRGGGRARALPAAPSAMAEARAAIAVITPDDLAREDGPILAARVLKRARLNRLPRLPAAATSWRSMSMARCSTSAWACRAIPPARGLSGRCGARRKPGGADRLCLFPAIPGRSSRRPRGSPARLCPGGGGRLCQGAVEPRLHALYRFSARAGPGAGDGPVADRGRGGLSLCGLCAGVLWR
jgi:hypothetical protein